MSSTKRGYDLNIEVAEHCMGWERVRSIHTAPRHRLSPVNPGEIIDDWNDIGPHEFLALQRFGQEEVRVALCGCASKGEIPDYSGNMRAAWQVVEHMVANGWMCATGTTAKGHACFFTKESQPRTSAKYRETMPIAICLAALDAWNE